MSCRFLFLLFQPLVGPEPAVTDSAVRGGGGWGYSGAGRREEAARSQGPALRDVGTPRFHCFHSAGQEPGWRCGAGSAIPAGARSRDPRTPGPRDRRAPGARARAGRSPSLLEPQSRAGTPGAPLPGRDFPVLWAEGQPGTRAQSPPRSGADPPGIRPAAGPGQGCDRRRRAQPGLCTRGRGWGPGTPGSGNRRLSGVGVSPSAQQGAPAPALRPPGGHWVGRGPRAGTRSLGKGNTAHDAPKRRVRSRTLRMPGRNLAVI